jgi:hypothetical protein
MTDWVEVPYTEVLQAWVRADAGRRNGRTTRAILEWLNRYVEKWAKCCPLTEDLLSELRVIGHAPDHPWRQWVSCSFRVSECSRPDGANENIERSPLTLVAVQEPRTERRVLIDGNKRAWVLCKRLECGLPIPPQTTLYAGTLTCEFIRAAKAVSSLWR